MNAATPSRKAVARFATALGLAIVVSAVSAQTQAPAQRGSTIEVKDWDVYVDLPTHFAFVKTPNGWVFVRQLDDEQMTRLPASTLTALLPVDDGDIRYAHPALEPSPRVQAMRHNPTRQAGLALREPPRQH